MAEIDELGIQGTYLVTPEVHADPRGVFVETYRRSWIPNGREMLQANRGYRDQGSLVGLHFHQHQADLWNIFSGHARVVLHDLRDYSDTAGVTLCMDLGDVEGRETAYESLYIPPGVAHGFAALSDMCINYLVDSYYNPDDELGVAWDDPEIAADWGIEHPIVSERDAANPKRADVAESNRCVNVLRT